MAERWNFLCRTHTRTATRGLAGTAERWNFLCRKHTRTTLMAPSQTHWRHSFDRCHSSQSHRTKATNVGAKADMCTTKCRLGQRRHCSFRFLRQNHTMVHQVLNFTSNCHHLQIFFLAVSHLQDITIGRVASQASNENLGHAPTRTGIRV
jgi:hypothetical protein